MNLAPKSKVIRLAYKVIGTRERSEEVKHLPNPLPHVDHRKPHFEHYPQIPSKSKKQIPLSPTSRVILYLASFDPHHLCTGCVLSNSQIHHEWSREEPINKRRRVTEWGKITIAQVTSQLQWGSFGPSKTWCKVTNFALILVRSDGNARVSLDQGTTDGSKIQFFVYRCADEAINSEVRRHNVSILIWDTRQVASTMAMMAWRRDVVSSDGQWCPWCESLWGDVLQSNHPLTREVWS